MLVRTNAANRREFSLFLSLDAFFHKRISAATHRVASRRVSHVRCNLVIKAAGIPSLAGPASISIGTLRPIHRCRRRDEIRRRVLRRRSPLTSGGTLSSTARHNRECNGYGFNNATSAIITNRAAAAIRREARRVEQLCRCSHAARKIRRPSGFMTAAPRPNRRGSF